MADMKEVMAWALELGNKAFTEARGGNVALLNRLGTNSSLKLFLDNVLGTGSVTSNQFPAYYPGNWQEITRLYEEYQRGEQVTEAVDKVASLETKLNELAEAVQKLTEAMKPAPVQETVETGKGKKKGAKVEATEEQAEDAAESEA